MDGLISLTPQKEEGAEEKKSKKKSKKTKDAAAPAVPPTVLSTSHVDALTASQLPLYPLPRDTPVFIIEESSGSVLFRGTPEQMAAAEVGGLVPPWLWDHLVAVCSWPAGRGPGL